MDTGNQSSGTILLEQRAQTGLLRQMNGSVKNHTDTWTLRAGGSGNLQPRLARFKKGRAAHEARGVK